MLKICNGPIYQSTMLKTVVSTAFTQGYWPSKSYNRRVFYKCRNCLYLVIRKVGSQPICHSGNAGVTGKTGLTWMVQSCQAVFRNGTMSHRAQVMDRPLAGKNDSRDLLPVIGRPTEQSGVNQTTFDNSAPEKGKDPQYSWKSTASISLYIVLPRK